MRMAQAFGKIGQRAEIQLAGGRHLQLYEAQMANAGEDYQGYVNWEELPTLCTSRRVLYGNV